MHEEGNCAPDPRSPIPDPETVTDAWAELRSVLLRARSAGGCEDLVQDVLTKLVARAADPAAPETLGLARFMLKCLRIDRARSAGLASLTTGVDLDRLGMAAASKVGMLDCRNWFDQSQQKALGRRAMDLLNEIVNGCSSTKALALRFAVDPRSISRRRRRLQAMLVRFLLDITD